MQKDIKMHERNKDEMLGVQVVLWGVLYVKRKGKKRLLGLREGTGSDPGSDPGKPNRSG